MPAAGSGRRIGGKKQFMYLAGRPLFLWALRVLAGSPEVDGAVLVVPPGDEELAASLLGDVRVRVVAGGDSRQESVRLGLAAVPADTQWVVVHDAARPLLREKDLAAVCAAAREYGAATLAVAAKDTVKTACDGMVAQTLPRENLWLVQTPQVFRYDWLVAAHARHQGSTAYDDAALVEMDGHPVKLVSGSTDNIKVTTPEDLLVAGFLLGGRGMRIGFGYDVHRLEEGLPLVLGGVVIPWERGLRGHSDADVLIHAVMDALLGAMGEGDIGVLFPDTDPEYQGIASTDLLYRVGSLLARKGYKIRNIDATVVAEKPVLAPYIPRMRQGIARVLGIASGQVNVKATTTEGLGAYGREEGMAAYAVALLE